MLDNSFDRDFSPINLENETQSKKRSVNDLFGDIDDILVEDNFHKHKKTKTKRDYNEDMKVINKIVELRQQNKHRYNLKSNNELNNRYNTQSRINHIKENLSFRVPRYPFIVVVRHDGERIYVRMHSEDYEKEEIKRVAEQSTQEGFLLGQSFKDMVEKAKQYLQQQEELKKKKENITNEDITETDNAQLWVDLYKPRKYLELLSDESTNRTLLRWIKLWDKVVFKRRPKIAKKNVKSKKGAAFFKKNELDETLDENDRPKNKIALLCGAPGLGKTTLAHMVAKHAGNF